MDIELIKTFALTMGIVDFLIYVVYIWAKYGVQKSISISFYDLPKDERFIFRIFVWILSISIIASGIGWNNPLFATSGALLSLVGFFSNIEDRNTYIVHMIGAVGGMIACYIGILTIDFEIGLIAGGLIITQSILTCLLSRKNNYLWNIEISCFTWMMLSLLYLVNVA